MIKKLRKRDRRTHILQVRFSPAEEEILTQRVMESGLGSKAEYIRNQTLTGPIHEAPEVTESGSAVE